MDTCFPITTEALVEKILQLQQGEHLNICEEEDGSSSYAVWRTGKQFDADLILMVYYGGGQSYLSDITFSFDNEAREDLQVWLDGILEYFGISTFYLKPEWILTDDSCWQHARQIDSQTYELIELGNRIAELNYCEVYTDTIHLPDYPEEEQLSILKTFGYDSIDTVREASGSIANQIIAECIFAHYGTHAHAVEPVFTGTEDECMCYICRHVQGDFCNEN